KDVTPREDGHQLDGGFACEFWSGELLRDGGFKLDGFDGVEPACLSGLVAHGGDPDNAPDNRGQAFDDERVLPAETFDEEAGDRGHPKHGDRVAEQKDAVGARALRTGEPARYKQQHGGEGDALRNAEDEADDAQHGKAVQHASERGEYAPHNQRDEDDAGGADAAGEQHARDLKEEIAEEEHTAE